MFFANQILASSPSTFSKSMKFDLRAGLSSAVISTKKAEAAFADMLGRNSKLTFKKHLKMAASEFTNHIQCCFAMIRYCALEQAAGFDKRSSVFYKKSHSLEKIALKDT